MRPYNGKRLLDYIGAGVGAALFAPLMVGLTIATCVADGPPPLFLQERVGQGRRTFTTVKIRTMRGQRVTGIGSWLRQTGLDEVPQFLNVCRGDMSLVGPRPLTADDVDRLGWQQAQMDWRFNARPGITGLSQLMAGNGAKASRRYDRLYLRNQSARLDIELLLLSFAANVVGKKQVRRWLRHGARSSASSRGSLTSANAVRHGASAKGSN